MLYAFQDFVCEHLVYSERESLFLSKDDHFDSARAPKPQNIPEKALLLSISGDI